MTLKYKKVSYKNKYYAIIELSHKDDIKPMIMDYSDFQYIQNLNKSWKCNQSNLVSCTHTYDDTTKEIFMHDIVMSLINKENSTEKKNVPIVHINTIGLDNRRDNLIYDNQYKDENKNFKKKKRTITLPKGSGISPDELPTYVWYLKPHGSHGERFTIEIGDFKWKTTSSKKKSLRYKLEEAKQYMRELKKNRPDVFEDRCMNGEYTKHGKKLLKSYYKLSSKSGYDIEKVSMDGITDKYLMEQNKDISKQEQKILTNKKNNKRKK